MKKCIIKNVLTGDVMFTANIAFENNYKESVAKGVIISIEVRKGTVDFSNSDLSGAMLSGENLSNLNFKGVDFSGADCRHVNFSNSDLEGSNFTNSECGGTNFTNANCKQVKFINANCEYANFTDSNVVFVDSTGVKLRHIVFRQMSLSEHFVEIDEALKNPTLKEVTKTVLGANNKRIDISVRPYLMKGEHYNENGDIVFDEPTESDKLWESLFKTMFELFDPQWLKDRMKNKEAK